MTNLIKHATAIIGGSISQGNASNETTIISEENGTTAGEEDIAAGEENGATTGEENIVTEEENGATTGEENIVTEEENGATTGEENIVTEEENGATTGEEDIAAGEENGATTGGDIAAEGDIGTGGDINIDMGDGMNMENNPMDGINDNMGEGITKDPFLANIPAMSAVSGAVLLIGAIIGFLLAKKKIKKGFGLYED